MDAMLHRSVVPGLRWLLAATVALPVLVFTFGTRQGQVVFVLYREPKLAAIQILGWSLLGFLFWTYRESLRARSLLAEALRPPWRWLALFLAYGLVTGLWVAVPANLFYELSQYALLLLLVLSLGIWSGRDAAVPAIVEHGLVLGIGATVLVGLVQAAFPIAVLSPIDPGSGVANPSFLGYKNVMALAIVGQVFLLVRLILVYGRCRRGRLLALLLAAELVYLASLKSRTSYLALLGGGAVLLVLLAIRKQLRWRAALAGALAVALFVVALAADPGARNRAGSMLSYVRHPARYLESDRGTYLLNSLQMVRYHPLGVGFGDWQTQYPVYRLHRRDLYFTATVQVRKAHSDHVQTFAETGWPGFALWSVFWASLLAVPIRAYLRSGGTEPLLLAAQVAAYGIAMGTDYVTEHPYLKFELLLVAFLAARGAAPRILSCGRPSRWLAVAVTVLAMAGVGYSICSVYKANLAATATARYVAAMEHRELRGGGPDLGPIETELLQEGSRAGAAMARTPGYGKGLSDDYRVLSQIELELGRRREALTYARTSLRFHPYSPNTFRLMAELLRKRRPSAAAEWNLAADYIMNQATHGF